MAAVLSSRMANAAIWSIHLLDSIKFLPASSYLSPAVQTGFHRGSLDFSSKIEWKLSNIKSQIVHNLGFDLVTWPCDNTIDLNPSKAGKAKAKVGAGMPFCEAHIGPNDSYNLAPGAGSARLSSQTQKLLQTSKASAVFCQGRLTVITEVSL